MIEFTMPSLGADMEDGTLVEWRVKSGDFVKRGDIIADVDTQKGLIEIEVFDEGTINELIVKEGEKVPVGTVMAIIIPVGKKVSANKKSASIPSISSPACWQSAAVPSVISILTGIPCASTARCSFVLSPLLCDSCSDYRQLPLLHRGVP